nr:hypothetical protein [Kordiimonas gwangyangensis]
MIRPHPAFRIFATANTVGLGDTTGLYHGTQQINQGQMDRWNIVATLNYLPHDTETDIIIAKEPGYDTDEGRKLSPIWSAWRTSAAQASWRVISPQ